MQQSYLLTTLTFIPLVGVIALLLLRNTDHKMIRRLAMITAVVEFVLSLTLLRGFDMHAGGYQWEEFRNWIPQPPIHYHLGVDGLSLFLVILTTLLTPISILASWKSIDERVKGFFISLLVLETGNADLHVLRRLTRQQRHAVVGLLAGEHAAITCGDQRRIGELVVLQLGFLDADDVRAEVPEPLLQVRQADIERIDVPRGDLHGGILPGPALVDANLGWRRQSPCANQRWQLPEWAAWVGPHR